MVRLPGKSDLKGAISCDERCQAGKRLFAGAADTDKQRMTTRHTNDTRDRHQVSHGVLEENKIQTSTTNTLVVLSQ